MSADKVFKPEFLPRLHYHDSTGDRGEGAECADSHDHIED